MFLYRAAYALQYAEHERMRRLIHTVRSLTEMSDEAWLVNFPEICHIEAVNMKSAMR